MAKCILHVGMHKTGTTSIQYSLQDLDDEKFYYARIQNRPNHSITIAAIFQTGEDAHVAKKLAKRGNVQSTEMAERARPDLDASVKAANGRTLVLSGEGFVRMPLDDLVALKNYLEAHGYDDIEVVAYVRSPAAYISSAMQQKLKNGVMRQLRVQACFPGYREKFEKFDELFGAAKVRLFKFDPEAFPDGDVVSDFCQRMGIPLSSINITRKNESITRLAAQMRYQYTEYAEAEGLRPLRGNNTKRLLEWLRSLDAVRFRLAPSVILPRLPKIQADVEWMEKRLGQSLAEPGLVDQDGDIRSHEDLLVPVPGINEKLRGLLDEAGVDVPPGKADNTWKLLSLIARIGSTETDEGEADAKAKRKAERRAARLLAGGGKGGGKGGRKGGGKLGRKTKLDAEDARSEAKANRKARRRGEQVSLPGEVSSEAVSGSHDTGKAKGRGAGLKSGAGAGGKEERQRRRDERIVALVQQAVATATAANIAAQPAADAAGAGANRERRGLGRGPGMGRGQGMGRGPGLGRGQGMGAGAGRQGPGNRQGMGQGRGMGHGMDPDQAQSRGQGRGQGMRQGKGPGMGAGPAAGGGGRKGKGPGRKGDAQLKPPKEVLQMPRANARPDAPDGPRRQPPTPITGAPMPLINIDKNLAVLWSPKSACTTVYVWFSHISGFGEDVRDYSTWPHRHRQEQYMKSDLYNDSAANGMDAAKLLRIIRDPYSRAVSIYRHALHTLFADKDMEVYSNGKISAAEGYSFQTFLDMAATLDMRRVDIHFRPQFHLYETQRKADRVINISKQDLFTELNAFEAEINIPKTNFKDLDWLHEMESKRKAKQEPMEGDTLDTVAFSRHQVNKLGLFPNYGQLLTPLSRRKIEAIYKADFDAYRDFL